MRKKFESAKFAAVALDLLCLEVDDENSVIAKVLLSVHMLIYVAAHALDHYKIKITQALPTLSLTTRFLMRRMIDNGWCGKRLNLFESILSSTQQCTSCHRLIHLAAGLRIT